MADAGGGRASRFQPSQVSQMEPLRTEISPASRLLNRQWHRSPGRKDCVDVSGGYDLHLPPTSIGNMI